MNTESQDNGSDTASAKSTPRFTWNAGAWFGSSIGGNLGLLVGAFQFIPKSLGIGLTWLAAYLCIVIVAIQMWRSRKGEDAYIGLQTIMAVAGLGWLICLGAIVFVGPELIPLVSGPPATSAQKWLVSTLQQTPLLTFLPLLVFPALMYFFYRLNQKNSYVTNEE